MRFLLPKQAHNSLKRPLSSFLSKQSLPIGNCYPQNLNQVMAYHSTSLQSKKKEDHESLVDRHWGKGSLMERIEQGLKLAGKDLNNALQVKDLAPVDALHSRGQESFAELVELGAGIWHEHTTVLDVGCGLGGTARHLAHLDGKCRHVTGLDLTRGFIEVGQRLTNAVGLDHKVTLCQGSALDLPFPENSFDVVWTEHVQMNIEDKVQFYSELYRVLVPGGTVLFHDVFRGTAQNELPEFPLPWAETPTISFLTTVEEAQHIMQKQAGFRMVEWVNKDQAFLAFMNKMREEKEKLSKEDGNADSSTSTPPLGLHLVLGTGETFKTKMKNHAKGIASHALTVAMGRLEKPLSSSSR